MRTKKTGFEVATGMKYVYTGKRRTEFPSKPSQKDKYVGAEIRLQVEEGSRLRWKNMPLTFLRKITLRMSWSIA
jgi:hypothetical protein